MSMGQVMETISYGLYVLGARQGVKDNGCVINTVIQATTRPNQVVFTVNKKNYTHDMVRETGAFTLSVLSREAGLALYQRFGFQSGREVDKFAGLEPHVRRGDNGILYLTQGVNAWMAGRVVSATDLGSHSLFLADVTGGEVLSPAPSATYAYYQKHVKPSPGVTVQGKEPRAPGQKRWVCKVCGYVYEGDELPADFICPWCKHPASDFEPLP